jgi:hypothetical protein
MQALMIYTSKCNNLNILRHDVLFILRLINVLFIFIFITQLLVGPPVPFRAFTRIRYCHVSARVTPYTEILDLIFL